MGKIIINVDWTKNYAAAPANEDIAVVAGAKSLEELKDLMAFSLPLHLEGMRADGDAIPAEFEGELEFDYRLTPRALLHHTEGLVSRKALARVTGINLQQLSHYASGWRKPRPEMERRIVEGLHEIGRQLMAVTL